jgi:hypothetical protein
LGTNFVCAHAGDEIKRMASTSCFIGFSRGTCAVRRPLNRIGQKKSNDVRAPSQASCTAGSSGGLDARLRQFCRFYRSINRVRVFDGQAPSPVKKVRRGCIDRPRRYG